MQSQKYMLLFLEHPLKWMQRGIIKKSKDKSKLLSKNVSKLNTLIIGQRLSDAIKKVYTTIFPLIRVTH